MLAMNDTPIVKNKYRALLTEMLPYEIPLLLDNSGFYYNMLEISYIKVVELLLFLSYTSLFL